MSEQNIIVREAVEQRLIQDGFDGLYSDMCDCACKIGDLMPCDQPLPCCEAGYLGPGDEEHSFYINRVNPVVAESPEK